MSWFSKSSFRRIPPVVNMIDEVFEVVPFGALFDAFHQPFPKTTDIFTEQHINFGGISRLPLEIFELIFAALSPSSLDAARYTCRLWHAMIMSSSYILESVIKKTAVPELIRGALPHDAWLRVLYRQLDIEADLVKQNGDLDSWRTRHRECEISFYVAPVCSHPHVNHSVPPSSFSSAAFCIEGSPIAYLITELQAPKLAKPRNMAFYHIGSTQRPYHIASIPFSANNGHPRILSLMEARKSYGWMLVLEIDSIVKYYSIDPTSGSSTTDSPFTLTTLAIQGSPGRDQEYRKPKTVPSITLQIAPGNKSWECLAYLPSMEVSSQNPNLKLLCKD